MSGELVLVAGPEPAGLARVRALLEQEGLRVREALHGDAVLEALLVHHPTLLVTDAGAHGLELCRRLRADHNPIGIILLGAADGQVERVLGLEMGADDFVMVPFNPRELAARVRAILRRASTGIPQQSRPVIHVGELSLDPVSREAHIQDRLLELRTREFDLLVALAGHRGQVLSREQLLLLAWGSGSRGGSRTVDVHIAHLRRKLGGTSLRIETVTGSGYRLMS
jgi:DNA-binding response OmpR family regulator